MDFVLLLMINIFFLSIMYLLLRRQVDKTYNQKEFLAKVETEIAAILTEMNQTTDRNLQLLEHRLGSLKEMTQKADEVIKRLSTEYHSYQDRLDKKKHVIPNNSQALDRLYGVESKDKIQPNLDQSDGSHTPKVLTGNPPTIPTGIENSSSISLERKEPSREDRKAKVLQYLIEGLNPQEIAEKTGFSIAEIELILALTKR